jgi:hypothetical protein
VIAAAALLHSRQRAGSHGRARFRFQRSINRGKLLIYAIHEKQTDESLPAPASLRLKVLYYFCKLYPVKINFPLCGLHQRSSPGSNRPEGEMAMAKYLLVYSGGGMPASEVEQKAVLKDWASWFEKLGSAVVDGGNPFTPQAKSVASDGKVSAVPVGLMASGYSILQADSLDAAVAMAQSCPVLKGGAQISVFETFNAMGSSRTIE